MDELRDGGLLLRKQKQENARTARIDGALEWGRHGLCSYGVNDKVGCWRLRSSSNAYFARVNVGYCACGMMVWAAFRAEFAWRGLGLGRFSRRGYEVANAPKPIPIRLLFRCKEGLTPIAFGDLEGPVQ